ncbi:hypothetical protein Corgl_0005 [Coriobacterium glomerans PW2]|uniref:DUF721 domain-containing protein n=1 Tax=Coriobacterium glomerans (strain ATCC 49209 / DSM 20642 / JCM 10262 / PW2) TaxID=700015 RepID=F2N6T7_CORGP|nr:hypothetical protein [Coriobacterium glomerans]AEB06136.1 hypothetical protein Corgl_0005 [Coriobacterium glomerans PW2]
MSGKSEGRGSEPADLRALIERERERILRASSPQRREQMRRAERDRSIYAAWNSVCGGTREGRHVTGLRYLPESNELLVYLDEACWTQEFTMLREIVRGRMARAGAPLDGFVFKTSRSGYARPARPRSLGVVARQPVRPPSAPLCAEQLEQIESDVSSIEDEKLKEALKKAMIASFEWKKGIESSK